MSNTCKAHTFAAFAAVARRNLATSTPTRYSPIASRLKLPHSASSNSSITSTAVANGRKIPRTHFTSSRITRQDPPNENGPKRKAVSKRAVNNSLRKVALDAQRSRLVIRKSGKTRYVDPEADTKDVKAFCAAETYNLSRARYDLRREGYEPDPCGTGLFPQVLHVQTPNYMSRDEESGEERPQGAGDVFVFPSGCVVTWNVQERLAYKLVSRILPPAAGETGHMDKLEIEDLDYVEDESKETSRIIGDTIILGTKASEHYDQLTFESSDTEENRSPEGKPDRHALDFGETAAHHAASTDPSITVDTILAKIAFSSALARSTKLAVLENSLEHYFSTTRNIPQTLASGKKLKINRSQILQKTGELLLIRAQLNLYSELTDALPDLFWDSPHELGLEGYYEMVGRALDVGVRIKNLNEKMDYASEIAGVLSQRLAEKHSSLLEWIIILLICIEVGFGIDHIIREREERADKEEEKRTRELWEVWLERELRKSR